MLSWLVLFLKRGNQNLHSSYSITCVIMKNNPGLTSHSLFFDSFLKSLEVSLPWNFFSLDSWSSRLPSPTPWHTLFITYNFTVWNKRKELSLLSILLGALHKSPYLILIKNVGSLSPVHRRQWDSDVNSFLKSGSWHSRRGFDPSLWLHSALPAFRASRSWSAMQPTTRA